MVSPRAWPEGVLSPESLRCKRTPHWKRGGLPLKRPEPLGSGHGADAMRVPAVALWLALLAAALAAATSLTGILSPSTYARDTPAWAIQAVGQDYANLPVVLILFWSSALVRKGSVPAFLIWLGCLLYLVYAFAIYAFATHFNRLFLAYVAVLGLSSYAIVCAVVGVDIARVTAGLVDHPHRRGASNLLIAIGILFALLWLAEILPHMIANTVPATLVDTALLTNPVHVIDLGLLLPAMIVVGTQLRRQRPLGLLFAVPLLVFSVTMGLAILALFALSAARGMAVAMPAAIVVALVVVASGVYASLLLGVGGRGPRAWVD